MQTWKDLPRELILKAANSVDGHTIWKPSKFVDMGIPAALVATVTYAHKSDMSNGPKGMIFDPDGNVFASCAGVYGLDLLRAICADFKVEYRQCMGRGFQAQAMQAALAKALQS